MIAINLALLCWRLAMRTLFTARRYGPGMALLAPIHMLIGNLVAMLAAMRALRLYAGLVRHGRLHWDKTAHVLPGVEAAR